MPVIPADLANALPALVVDAEERLAPLDDDALQANLTAVMAALGAGLPQSEKTEFIAAGFLTCGRFPAGLCKEALQTSLTECTRLSQVLKFVKDYCEDYPERMRRRLDRLQQLLAVTEGRDHV